MKLSQLNLPLLLSAIIFSGCTPAFDISNDNLLKNDGFEHVQRTIKVPYKKALKNITTGLENCVKDLYTYSDESINNTHDDVEQYGRYHVLNKHASKSEYNLRLRMRGGMEGDCAICLPKGGMYEIYATLENKKGHTVLTSHFNIDQTRYVQGLEKWANGKLDSCYGFSMLDN